MQDPQNDPLAPDETDISLPDGELAPESAPDVNEADSALDNEAAETPKEETRARRAFRKFIRWSAGLLIVFGFGFLAAMFALYNPKTDELGQTQNDLESAGSTISELEGQISAQQDEIARLNDEISTLNQEISNLEDSQQALQEKEDGYHLQIALVKIRADVVRAQVELYEGNPAQARVLLESAHQALTTVETLLSDDFVVSPLQNRLELAIGEIEDDPETALADLNILAGDLLEIENSLFKE